MASSRNIDMLHGSLWDKILIVALPLALTGIMQQLFNAADIAMIGQFVGKEAMAAVGSNSSIITTLISLFIGISLGVNVVIAGFIGKHNETGVHMAVHTSLLIAFFCGIIMVCIGEAILRPILHFLQVPGEIFEMAVTYMRVFFLGMPAFFVYNFESSIFRSIGDTQTPLLGLVIAGIAKVLMNLFFLLVLHWSVLGVGIATAISPCISALLLFYLLCHSNAVIRIRFNEFRINTAVLKRILRIGVPAGIQGMVFALSNLVIQSAINSLGPIVMAASAAAFNIEIMAYFVINAFGQVSSTFISQNYGARNIDRCKQVTRICMIQDVIVSILIAIVILHFSTPLLGLFNGDAAVIAYGSIRLFYVLAPEFINTVLEILSGAMRGYGNSLLPAMVILLGICGTRVTYVYAFFPMDPTFDTLMKVFPISWTITAIVLIFAYHKFVKHLAIKA
ncbi:MAG: MATE family efflux transporter [Megasphaera sp.]|nr:MATE family efflux transporter [Megasphaera sp.]MCH4218359.1 MATE family efflux transporter [Megasphaera sp.]